MQFTWASPSRVAFHACKEGEDSLTMVCFDVTEESDEPLDPAAVPPMVTMFGS